MLVHPGDWALLNLWDAWKLVGGLPAEGSMLEQPAALIEGFRVLDAEAQLLAGAESSRARRRASKGERHA